MSATTEHAQRMAVRDRVKAALVAAQTERHQRDDLVQSLLNPREVMMGWNLYEVEATHEAINKERARLGRGPVALIEVAKIESNACGHSDYTAKFALYAADLVYVDTAREVWV